MLSGKLQAGASDPNAWNLDNAVYQGSPINWFAYGSSPDDKARGVCFKPDGLKMYISEQNSQTVTEYDLSVAWDVSTAVFLQSFYITGHIIGTGIFFKPDGSKFYIAASGVAYEYDLSTAWDVSTAVFLQSFNVGNPRPDIDETSTSAIFFKPDGSKMIILGTRDDKAYSFNLSTAWDISTSSFSQQLFYVGDTMALPVGLSFKPDGSKMYVIDLIGQKDIAEYDLSTAWDVSTAVLLQSFSVAPPNNRPRGVFFKPDGLAVYVIGDFGDNVNKFGLSVAWDIATTSYIYPTTDFVSVAAQDTAPHGLFFKPDGLKMYVVGYTNDNVYEYDLSVAWDISTASYLQSLSVAPSDSTPVSVFFRPDGLKMYVLGIQNHSVYEYNLSVAWDISTSSSGFNFSVFPQEPSPSAFFFKPDGLKMYVVGTTNDSVQEYNLSVAWSVTSAAYTQSFSVAAQDTLPIGIFFKPNGKVMYVAGGSSDSVYEYDLPVDWSVTSAVYTQSLSVAAQDIFPRNLFFKPNGKVMYLVGGSIDGVFSYDFV